MSRAERHEIEEVKREINEETSEGGVTVRIGTREEIDLANKAAEQKGKVETLAEYIKLNKQIIATAEELNGVLKDKKHEDLLKEFEDKPTGAWLYDALDIYFKDKDGNLARFRIWQDDMRKITEFNPIVNSDQRDRTEFLTEKMADIGFGEEGSWLFGKEVGGRMHIINDWVEEARRIQTPKQSKEKFNF